MSTVYCDHWDGHLLRTDQFSKEMGIAQSEQRRRSDRRHDMLYIARPDDCRRTSARRARRCSTIQLLFICTRYIPRHWFGWSCFSV